MGGKSVPSRVNRIIKVYSGDYSLAWLKNKKKPVGLKEESDIGDPHRSCM